MQKISLRIVALLLVTSLSACKPTSPNPPTITPVAVHTSTTLSVTPTPAPPLTSPGWTTYPEYQSIKDMAFDQDNNLWMVGPNGAFVLNSDGSQGHFTIEDGLPSNDLLSVGLDFDGSVWVGSNGSGVARYDGTSWQTFTTADGLAGDVVLDIIMYIAHNGVLFGTTQGLSWYNGEKWENYTSPASMPDDEVRSIAVPHWDTFWLGTARGLQLFETSQAYTTQDGLVDDEINTIAYAPDCSLWIGTPAGVSHKRGEVFTSYTSADGLADDYVSAAAVTLDGAAWLGTPMGLSRLDGKGWTTYTTADGLADNDVLSILVAPDETLWIGTAASLSHYSPSLNAAAGQPGSSTYAVSGIAAGFEIFYGKDGTVWKWQAGEKSLDPTQGRAATRMLSTDGSLQAYFRQGDSPESGLWVSNSDGSDPRLLVSTADLQELGKYSENEESKEFGSHVVFNGVSWVPSTHEIVYGTYRDITRDGRIFHDDLNLVDADTGEKTSLLPPGQGGEFLFSPDGSQLAIIGQNQISIMDADGSNRHDKLLEYPTIHNVDWAYYPQPVWSPDGQYLLLALPSESLMSNEQETVTIWKIPADGSPAIRLGSFQAVGYFFDYTKFSPDLSHLAYMDESEQFEGGRLAIHIANADGTGDRVNQEGFGVYFVSWSPDGQHYLYHTTTTDEIETWYVSDLDGNSTLLPYAPVQAWWVDNETLLHYESLGCGYQLSLSSLDGESQVIDVFWTMPSIYSFSYK
jgi:hypothetical protein